jgi:CBS domain-containing protein
MASKVRDVMTRDPLTVSPSDTLTDAAKQMRDADVGVLIVAEGNRYAVVTDRDIVVRAVAEERDPANTRLSEVITNDLIAVSPDDDQEVAVELMRTHAVRRLPVLDGEELVGVVSLGDLAVERDSDSVLAEISAEEPNN